MYLLFIIIAAILSAMVYTIQNHHDKSIFSGKGKFFDPVKDTGLFNPIFHFRFTAAHVGSALAILILLSTTVLVQHEVFHIKFLSGGWELLVATCLYVGTDYLFVKKIFVKK